MKVVESLPDVGSDRVADSGGAADRVVTRSGTGDSDRVADRVVTRPGTGEGSLVVSAAEEAVTMPLADQARANGRPEQLARLRPRGQK